VGGPPTTTTTNTTQFGESDVKEWEKTIKRVFVRGDFAKKAKKTCSKQKQECWVFWENLRKRRQRL